MKSTTFGRPIEILLVDDSATDVMLAEEALEHGKVSNNLNVVKDGVEAMAFLRNEGQYADSPRPDLMLLDLNMPRKDGRTVLAEIKSDPDLRTIPVVVLTTSKADEDIYKSYDLGVNSYIVKPVTFEALVDMLQTLEKYWFEIVELPPTRESGN